MFAHKGAAVAAVVFAILGVWFLLTPPVLVAGGAWVGAGLAWPARDVALLGVAAVALLGITRWVTDRILAIGAVVEGPRFGGRSFSVHAAAGMLFLVSGLIFMLVVDLFFLPPPWRAVLLAVVVPGLFSGIYAAGFGLPRRRALLSLASWTLLVVGAGFVLASLFSRSGGSW